MIYVCSANGLKKWDEPEQIEDILNDLEKYKDKIVGLELCHNSIGEKCAKSLGQKMKNLKNLRYLDLSDCFVSRGSEELPKCLKYLLEGITDKPIIELKLNDNALGPTAAPGYEFFFKENKTLEKLYLNNCGMGPIGTPNLIKILIENKNMPLRVLKMSRNKMENTGCISLSELIKEKKLLKEIQISDNEISGEGMESFFNSLKNNSNIFWIDAHNNTLGGKLKSFPNLIESLNNINYLNLSDLTIENKNIIKSLFNILPKLNELRVFHFEYCLSDIDFSTEKEKKEFLSEIFDCLLKVKNLKELILENNDIPNNLYLDYLPKFKKKGLYLFSCYSEEEKEADQEQDEEEN